MSRFRIALGLTVLLLAGSLAAAKSVGRETKFDWDKPSLINPGPEWSKSKDGFAAMVLMSDNPDEVLESWASPTASIPVRTADRVTRGVPIVAFVFFSGCLPDKHGMCNASVDFTILEPDGQVYDQFENRDLWKGKPAPPEGMLRLSAEYVGAIIEPSDPLGRYQVIVSVHDLNAGTTLELKQAFTAIDAEE